MTYQSQTIGSLAPQQLYEEANKMLARDRGRLAGSPRPQYQGQTVAPMSAMTQQAQALRNQYANQPQPYSQKINTVLQRPNTGLDVNRLLAPQMAAQEQFGRTNMMDTMRAQMGHATPQMNPFMQNFQRIQGEVGDVSRGNLNNLSRIAGELEGKRNTGIAEAFRGLQANTQARREAQIGGLTQMGQQKHAHGNMMLGGQKAQFEEEADAPYAKMQKMGRYLDQNGANFSENVHPDLQKPLARELVQGLHAYGVDTSKPLQDWDNTRRADDGVFRGPRTAPLPPEVLASHNMMMGVTPRLEGPASDERRRLVDQLMSPESLSEKAMQNIPEHIRPQIANLRRTAQRNFGGNIGQITNRYIQANQPFSMQHTNEVQNRAEEVARRLAEEEAEVLKQGTASQLSSQHEKGIGDLKRLDELGNQEQNEFRNMMGTVTNLNKQGTDKWSNDQRDLEDIFQNYQQSSPWGFSPQMRADVMSQGMQKGRESAMAQMNNPDYINNLQLGNPLLETMGNRYSALNRERNSAAEQQRIASQEQAMRSIQSQMAAAQQQAAQQAQQYAQQQAQQRAQQEQQGRDQATLHQQQSRIHDTNSQYAQEFGDLARLYPQNLEAMRKRAGSAGSVTISSMPTSQADYQSNRSFWHPMLEKWRTGDFSHPGNITEMQNQYHQREAAQQAQQQAQAKAQEIARGQAAYESKLQADAQRAAQQAVQSGQNNPLSALRPNYYAEVLQTIPYNATPARRQEIIDRGMGYALAEQYSAMQQANPGIAASRFANGLTKPQGMSDQGFSKWRKMMHLDG